MKNVKVLGSGCKRCVQTAAMIEAEASRLGVTLSLEKVTDYAMIAGYGVMSTPAVVIDGTLVHAGGLPRVDDVTRWLSQ